MKKIPVTLIKLSESEIKIAIAFWLKHNYNLSIEFGNVVLWVKLTQIIFDNQEYDITAKIIIEK